MPVMRLVADAFFVFLVYFARYGYGPGGKLL